MTVSLLSYCKKSWLTLSIFFRQPLWREAKVSMWGYIGYAGLSANSARLFTGQKLAYDLHTVLLQAWNTNACDSCRTKRMRKGWWWCLWWGVNNIGILPELPFELECRNVTTHIRRPPLSTSRLTQTKVKFDARVLNHFYNHSAIPITPTTWKKLLSQTNYTLTRECCRVLVHDAANYDKYIPVLSRKSTAPLPTTLHRHAASGKPSYWYSSPW